MRKNPNCTIDDFVEHAGIKQRTVERNISALKTLGYIEREGSRKAGHWIVKT